MGSKADDFAKAVFEAPQHQDARRTKPEHPKGWEPGICLEGTKGTITSRPSKDRDPKWDEQLKHFGFDPEEFEILEPYHVRTWDAAIGDGKVQRFYYYRANIVSRIKGAARANLTELIKEIKRHKPPKKAPPAGDHAILVCPADLQVGKGENGGSAGITKRFLAMVDAFEERTKTLRRQGVPLGVCYLVNMGDAVENTQGHYDMQAFTADLNLREQITLARRLFLKLLRRAAVLYERVVFVTLPSNHGEFRKGSKAFTDFGDNIDLLIADELHDLCQENPEAYGHVSFVVPDKELTVTLEVAPGQIAAFAHGHQARSGGSNAQAKVRKWWEGQAFGLRAPGDASILVTADKHHFSVVQEGSRTHFQCSTLEGGSQWFTEGRGVEAQQSTLSFVVGPDGWDHLKLL